MEEEEEEGKGDGGGAWKGEKRSCPCSSYYSSPYYRPHLSMGKEGKSLSVSWREQSEPSPSHLS